MNKGLGFSPEDRKENIRRTAETAVLMADAGFIVLCSLVSPYIEDRRNARKIVEEKQMKFYEIFVNTPLEECINRDTKGLYRRAISGQIAGKAEKILKYGLDLIPSPLLKIQIMGGKDCLRCIDKTLLGLPTKNFYSKVCRQQIYLIYIQWY